MDKTDKKYIDYVLVGYSAELNYTCRDRDRINDKNINRRSYVLAEDNNKIKLYKGVRKGKVSEKSFDHITVHKWCIHCKGKNMTSEEDCNSCMNLIYEGCSDQKYGPNITNMAIKFFDLRSSRKDIINILTLLSCRGQHRLPYELVRTLKAYLY